MSFHDFKTCLINKFLPNYSYFLLQVKGKEDFDEQSDVGQLFRRAAGADMEIDWTELQKVLNASFQRGTQFFPACIYFHITITHSKRKNRLFHC